MGHIIKLRASDVGHSQQFSRYFYTLQFTRMMEVPVYWRPKMAGLGLYENLLTGDTK